MLLTIDAGNTRTKWAIFNSQGEMSQSNACLNSQLGSANFSPELLNYDRIIISNVAGEKHAAQLQKMLHPYGLPMHWISASEQACNVINDYEVAETLGSDRWAAMIAAWHYLQASCLVVNAGTAITIDGMIKTQMDHDTYGKFIGGIILPGLDLMRSSLGQAASQLPPPEVLPHTQAMMSEALFARNTVNAIYGGAISAITGAIEHMLRGLEMQSKQAPCIILSGGNATAIQNHLKNTVMNKMVKQPIIVDNLVLQGLFLLALPLFKNTTQSELE